MNWTFIAVVGPIIVLIRSVLLIVLLRLLVAKKIFQLIVLGSDIDNTCGKYGIDAGHGCINLIENCYEVQLVSFYMCYCLIGKLHKHCCQFNALLFKSN